MPPLQAPEFNPKEVGPTPLPKDAANDAVFQTTTEPLIRTPQELFSLRKAHEMQIKLGYRDVSVDKDALVKIQEEMSARGLREEDYVEFLKNYPTQGL